MPISLDELESHLFKCTDTIRSTVDPTNYKEYIFPLVYYKSISDEVEKQYEQNLKEYGKNLARREIVDYLIVPELTHLIEQHHRREFWQSIGKYVPKYKQNAEWRKQNSTALVFTKSDL